jgi:hypothetical protein
MRWYTTIKALTSIDDKLTASFRKLASYNNIGLVFKSKKKKAIKYFEKD